MTPRWRTKIPAATEVDAKPARAARAADRRVAEQQRAAPQAGRERTARAGGRRPEPQVAQKVARKAEQRRVPPRSPRQEKRRAEDRAGIQLASPPGSPEAQHEKHLVEPAQRRRARRARAVEGKPLPRRKAERPADRARQRKAREAPVVASPRAVAQEGKEAVAAGRAALLAVPERRRAAVEKRARGAGGASG